MERPSRRVIMCSRVPYLSLKRMSQPSQVQASRHTAWEVLRATRRLARRSTPQRLSPQAQRPWAPVSSSRVGLWLGRWAACPRLGRWAACPLAIPAARQQVGASHPPHPSRHPHGPRSGGNSRRTLSLGWRLSSRCRVTRIPPSRSDSMARRTAGGWKEGPGSEVAYMMNPSSPTLAY